MYCDYNIARDTPLGEQVKRKKINLLATKLGWVPSRVNYENMDVAVHRLATYEVVR